ncbi:hypothetical protein SBOR_0577 [Sclerotinia borealis F-4128]|uniref:Uncharacterized protein n=1 Tax=Sclerotinia borealis (strain F-4128) TaxID=1432307 RepID=W9CSE4_SCLBF|nr:hypothetical protein SBOR_0577 [Sclerotinia borealis F-4128]
MQTSQHKVLQVQFLEANYKFELCKTNGDQQTNLDISNSKTVTIKVTAQQINQHGNNRMFICRYLSANDQDQDQDSDHNNDSKPPKIFIAKEFGDNKDELDTYERLASLQGVYIPKCFGEICWKDEDETDTDAENDLMYYKYKKALEVIGNKEIFHGDIAFRNLMWSENRGVRIIDFENAKMETEILMRGGNSVQRQNFIDLKCLFKVEDNDIIRENLPIRFTRQVLEPPVLSKEMLERYWLDRKIGERLEEN